MVDVEIGSSLVGQRMAYVVGASPLNCSCYAPTNKIERKRAHVSSNWTMNLLLPSKKTILVIRTSLLQATEWRLYG